MKQYLKVTLAIFLCVMFLLSLMACGGREEEALSPVATRGLNEDEPVVQTTKTGGFTIDIHRTYAEIKSYDGSDTVLTLPDQVAGVSVRMIGESAFAHNKKITKVYLPADTIVIDRYAFDGCTKLTEVVLNAGLERIGDYAFRDSGLTSLTLPETLVTIGKYSFYRTTISSLVLPDSLSKVGKYAFYGCASLTSVTIGARLRELSEYLFYDCVSLTEVILPTTVTKLGDYAFRGCTALRAVFVPEETEKIGTGAFVDCPALTLYTPEGSAAETAAKRNGYRYVTCQTVEEMPSEG